MMGAALLGLWLGLNAPAASGLPGLPSAFPADTSRPARLAGNRWHLLPPPEEATAWPARLYPNPVQATSVVSFAVRKAGPVQITLLDAHGRTLQVVYQQTLPRGLHTVPVPGAALPRGSYFLQISTRTGPETLRFSKN